MKRQLLALALASTLVMPVLAGGAEADHLTAKASDPDDTEGRLDIARVKYEGYTNRTATLTLRTYEKWRCKFLRGFVDAPHTYAAGISWEINKDEDPANEKSGHFSCDDGKLFFTMDNDESIRAKRPDRRTAQVTIHLKPTKHLSLVAISRVNGEVDGELFVEAEDVAPDGRLTP